MLKINLLLLACLLIFITCKIQYSIVNKQISASIVKFTLLYTGKQEYYIKKTSPIIKNLLFTLQVHSFNDFYIKFTDLNNTRFEVPQETPFPIDPLANSTFSINLSSINFTFTQNPFDFRIERKINKAVLFSTYGQNFTFSDYYMEIGTQVNSDYIYGLGQRFSSNFRKTQGQWTIFNRDRPQQIDYGTGRQTYGFYPVYLLKQVNQYFHFCYFRNSNAMDIFIQSQHNKTFMIYKTIGGVLDFRFLLGQKDPEVLLQKWNNFLGASAVPPFWSLGFHQSRWGYHNISMIQTVIQKYQQNDIPLDTIWSDIDYMIKFQDFTIDQTRFPLDRMKKITQNYNYVPIIDAGIKVNDGIAYVQGKQRNVFVKTPKAQQLNGIVWPGATTFVDFFNPNATQYWIDMLNVLIKKVQFSGIWLDMNEFSNFCNGPCVNTITQQGFSYTHDIPYHPGMDGNIETRTIPLNSTHYNGYKQADVHAFNAMLQTYATNLYLKSKNKRPFIISRSSALGTNKYGFVWTGDNNADWQFLRSSIADNFNFQLYGIQMVGADICGFSGNTNEQLCSRWHQLGSLYPFSRNHNQKQSISQQPYVFGPTLLQCAKTNLRLRYSILKYYYSLFVLQRGTGSIFKPLFLAFPSDQNLYNDDICNSQFMIGPQLLATPIVQEKKTSRNIYLPLIKWYDLHSGQFYVNGTHQIINHLVDKVPLFLAQTAVIFRQDTKLIRQTKQLTNLFQMVVGLKLDVNRSNSTTQFYYANGSMISIKDYNDDLKIITCLNQGCQYFFNITFTKATDLNQIEINCLYSGYAGLNEDFLISKITLFSEKKVISQILDQPLTFKGSQKKIINVDSSEQSNLKKQAYEQ